VSACTGVAAQWCPVHGDCTCPWVNGHDLSDGFDPDAVRDMNDNACPLHSIDSSHAEPATAETELLAGRWPAGSL